MKLRIQVIWSVTFFFSGPAYGAVIHVPSEALTIQAGINAANEGDTVLVADGTFSGSGNRNLDFGGKGISVISENGYQNCVIDCEHSGRGFIFVGGEAGDSEVSGFKIRNGLPSGSTEYGGGILCEGTSPTIRNCAFTNNTGSSSPTYSAGGGLMCTNSASPSIINCIFITNRAQNGGGICSYGSSPIIKRCSFNWNSAVMLGGGIYLSGSSALIFDCIFHGNTGCYGGAIECWSGSDSLINNSLFFENSAERGGGGIDASDSSPVINNSLFIENAANVPTDHFGGGAISFYDSQGSVRNCTFSGNTAIRGGCIYCFEASPSIVNGILWGDTASQGSELYLGYDSEPSVLDISYSDVQGGQSGVYIELGCQLQWGAGMIDGDPLFTEGPDGAYYLSQTSAGQLEDSPCLDAGSAAAGTICFNISEGYVCLDQLTTRTDETPDAGIADMGYHDKPSSFMTPTPGPTLTMTPVPTSTPTTDPGIIRVPQDYDTIQEAIAASISGAVILVADGTYAGAGNTNVSFLGKGVAVISENGPQACVVDCQYQTRGFLFENEETSQSILEGFTIRNGYISGFGCGILCDGSSPQIDNCIIESCVNETGYHGGALCSMYGGNPAVTNCLIRNNQDNGLAASFFASLTVMNCTVTGSSINGVFCYGDSYVHCANSIIWNNSGQDFFIYESDAEVSYCDVEEGYPGTGNISSDPLFISGPYGACCLSQTAAGQPLDSPCLDAGSTQAENISFGSDYRRIYLNQCTTRTDNVSDQGTVDMGFHYFLSVFPSPTPDPADVPAAGATGLTVLILALSMMMFFRQEAGDKQTLIK